MGGRKARNRLCIDYAIRVCICMLLILLLLSLALLISGFTNIIQFEYGYGGVAGLAVCMGLIFFLLRYEDKRRDDSALRRISSIRSWVSSMLDRMGRRGVNEIPQDDSVPFADELITEERTDDPPSGEAVGESHPRRPESEMGRLARILVRRHSDSALHKTSPSQAMPAESRLVTELRQSLNEIPSEVPGPVRFWQSRRGEGLDIQVQNLLQPSHQVPSSQLTSPREPDQLQPSDQMPSRQLTRPREPDQVQSGHLARPWRGPEPVRRSRRVTDSNVERQNLRTLDVRQLPGQAQSWRMTRPEAPIPGSECEIQLRHPPQRPGLPAWPWQETPVGEDLTLSISVPERTRHGQSWPLPSTSRIPSELARPVVLPPPPLQRSRRLTGGEATRPDPQILGVDQPPDPGPNSQVERHEYLPIPGAVSELETGSKDPVQGQGLQVLPRQERPTRGPRPLVLQQEPGSHLQISALRERPAQGQCPLISRRQRGPLRIRQRASQGPDSEDSRSQQDPKEGSDKPTEETQL